MTHRSAEYDPYEHADLLGIQVVHGRLRSSNALWVPDQRTIVVKRGLRSFHERVAVTHEMGHICLGHRETTPRNELAADRFTARKLVNPTRLDDVMRTTDDTAVWCLELGITHRILDQYLKDHRAS